MDSPLHLARLILAASLLAGMSFLTGWAAAAPADELRELVEQNRRLQSQVEEQARRLEELAKKLQDLEKSDRDRTQEVRQLGAQLAEREPARLPAATAASRIVVSGEAAFAYFDAGTNGAFAKPQYRLDDAKLFVEAEIMRDVYALAGLDLFLREGDEEFPQLGEFYVDFENVSRHWGQDRLLSVRAGRINIPFGEEYQVRGVVQNPLVTHSLADFWGVDEGVEVYGQAGGLDYVLAVQNGNHAKRADFSSDKSVTLRLGGSPAPGWRLSASALRTGRQDAVADRLTELWFGNAFFRAIGPAATTTAFEVDVVQAELIRRWDGGHLAVAVGTARYDDNDTAADNSRRIRFWSAEAVQALAGELFGAVRYSAIDAPQGYPIAGLGNMGRFFFGNLRTERLWRLGLGLGYRFAPSLVWKAEYTYEGGRLVTGQERTDGDLLSTQVALRF